MAEVTEFYLVNLLSDFAATDKLFPEQEDGRKADEPLAMLYPRAQAQPREERIRTLRRLGDVSLYTAGFFSDSLRERVVGPDYYIQMGGTAYGQVASLSASGGFAFVYHELGTKFRALVEVLEEIAARGLVANGPSGALKVYESWVRTGTSGSSRCWSTPASSRRRGWRTSRMLEAIQEHLEAIYGMRSEARASAFVVGSEQARALGRHRALRRGAAGRGRGGRARAGAVLLARAVRARRGLERCRRGDRPRSRRLLPARRGRLALPLPGEHRRAGAHASRCSSSRRRPRSTSSRARCSMAGTGGVVHARALVGRLFDQVRYRATLSRASAGATARRTGSRRTTASGCCRSSPRARSRRCCGAAPQLPARRRGEAAVPRRVAGIARPSVRPGLACLPGFR